MYVIYDPAEPDIPLDFSGTLDGIATLLAAKRGGGTQLTVGANDTGHTRPINEAEQRELDERVRAEAAVEQRSSAVVRQIAEQQPDERRAGRLMGNKAGDEGVGGNAGEDRQNAHAQRSQ